MLVFEIFDNSTGLAVATCIHESDAMDLVSEHNDRASEYAWDYQRVRV